MTNTTQPLVTEAANALTVKLTEWLVMNDVLPEDGDTSLAERFGRFSDDVLEAALSAAPAGEVVDHPALTKALLGYGGRCRDCADCAGICCNGGLPCDPKQRVEAIETVLHAVRYYTKHPHFLDEIAAHPPQEPAARPDAALVEALRDFLPICEPNICPTPDKPNSNWAKLQRVKEALADSAIDGGAKEVDDKIDGQACAFGAQHQSADALTDAYERAMRVVEEPAPCKKAADALLLRLSKAIRALASAPGRGEVRDIATAPIDEDVLVFGYHEDDRDTTEPRWFVGYRTDFQPHLWWIAGTMENIEGAEQWVPLPPAIRAEKGEG